MVRYLPSTSHSKRTSLPVLPHAVHTGDEEVIGALLGAEVVRFGLVSTYVHRLLDAVLGGVNLPTLVTHLGRHGTSPF